MCVEATLDRTGKVSRADGRYGKEVPQPQRQYDVVVLIGEILSETTELRIVNDVQSGNLTGIWQIRTRGSEKARF